MKHTTTQVPATIDAYIAEFPADTQARLKKIREAIRKAAPDAEELISYRIPTFKLAGRPLLYFAAFKEHIGLYSVTDDVKAAFAKELTGFAQSKGTVRFFHDRLIPYGLIGKIAKFKVKEDAAKGKSKPTNKPRADTSSADRKKQA